MGAESSQTARVPSVLVGGLPCGLLSQLRGSALDLAFVQVMTATEVSDGSLPEVRQLAHQMLAEQLAQSRQFKHWSLTAKARTSHPPAKTPAPKPIADII